MMAARQSDHAAIRGVLRTDEPMSRHTTWRVGGPADRYFEPADLDDLSAMLASLPMEEAVTWIGLGSNLLVRDGGVRGTVINTVNLDVIEWHGEDRIDVQAGVPCAKVARMTARAGFGGAEFLCGIPGTMGGALAMNAGAFGGETWNIVEQVWVIGRDGRTRDRTRDEYAVGYREVRPPAADEWFVAARLRVQRDPERGGEARIRALLARRGETQPTGLPSCGSVFRNPPADYAGRLIESCGLKGHRIGGAFVSEKHANFIITEHGATASDVERLLQDVTIEVQRRHGVLLHAEVRVIGEALR